MAAGTSPLSALLTSKLAERLANRGTPGGGAAGVASPDAGAEQLQSQFQGLQGSDPEFALKAIKQMIQFLSQLYIRLVMQVPDAAQKIADAQKALNKSLESLQKAAATLNTVRPQIANSANLPPGFAGQGGAGGGDGMGGGGASGMMPEGAGI
jgi:hypothetical protein